MQSTCLCEHTWIYNDIYIQIRTYTSYTYMCFFKLIDVYISMWTYVQSYHAPLTCRPRKSPPSRAQAPKRWSHARTVGQRVFRKLGCIICNQCESCWRDGLILVMMIHGDEWWWVVIACMMDDEWWWMMMDDEWYQTTSSLNPCCPLRSFEHSPRHLAPLFWSMVQGWNRHHCCVIQRLWDQRKELRLQAVCLENVSSCRLWLHVSLQGSNCQTHRLYWSWLGKELIAKVVGGVFKLKDGSHWTWVRQEK